MALCCIGGVCIPYTAILPLLALALKWVVERLVSAGILPAHIAAKFGIMAGGGGTPASSSSSSSCCKISKNCTNNGTCTTNNGTSTSSSELLPGKATIHEIRDEDEWQTLVQTHRLVVVKMTAAWCKPCKAIQPFYETLAGHYSAKFGTAAAKQDVCFATLDVDECDEIASAMRVAMMPTFCIVQGGKEQEITKPTVLDKYAGSNEAALQNFLAKTLDKQ